MLDVALAAHFKQGRTISGRGMFMKPKSEVVPETGEMDPDSCQAHACTVAEVEVDDETGEVRVLKLTNAYEIGRAINPALAHQQIVGGAWMGISHALYETTEPYYPDRAHGPLDFSQYLMPGPGDIAEMDSVIIERPAAERPLWRQGHRRDDGELADPGDRQRHLRRLRRAGDLACRSRRKRSCAASTRCAASRTELSPIRKDRKMIKVMSLMKRKEE